VEEKEIAIVAKYLEAEFSHTEQVGKLTFYIFEVSKGRHYLISTKAMREIIRKHGK
jgi:hypothetical protein